MELLNTVIEWLKETDIPLSKISKHTGIDRKTLHNWKSGSKPNYKVYLKLRDYYVKHNSDKQDIPLTATGTIDSEYVINLQQQQIQTLQQEKIRASVWEALEYDVHQHILIKAESWVPPSLNRTILDAGDLNIWTKHLGYSEKELLSYFRLNEQFPLFDHPVHQIITENSNGYLKSIALNSLAMFQLLKNAVGNYYIPFHLTYIAKDGSTVPSVAYCLIDWKTMNVQAKVKFLG